MKTHRIILVYLANSLVYLAQMKIPVFLVMEVIGLIHPNVDVILGSIKINQIIHAKNVI